MRFERRGAGLALLAALLTGAPAWAAPRSADVIWLELCDAAHSGRRIPLPLRRDRDPPPPAGCHAGCALMPERRVTRR
jgi:hypothetical protein